MTYRIKERDGWFTVQCRILWFIWVEVSYPERSIEEAEGRLAMLKSRKYIKTKYHYR